MFQVCQGKLTANFLSVFDHFVELALMVNRRWQVQLLHFLRHLCCKTFFLVKKFLTFAAKG